MLNSREVILGLVAASPGKKLPGKKRLQKLAYLLKFSGIETSAEFRILHYGVFSRELAESADFLVVIDEISVHEEPVGPYGTYQSIYSVESSSETNRLKNLVSPIVARYEPYGTVVLEVASTICYFMDQGLSRKEAISKTREMKPEKTVSQILAQSSNVVDLALQARESRNERSSENKRSNLRHN